MPEPTLTTTNHDRASAGMTYVYPVVSRRSAGLSLGVNLNPNNACNWRCIYCQVPNLSRGGPPPIDLTQLEAELRRMLTDVVQGDFLTRQVPEGMRRLNDVALSGNGEPTSAPEFPRVITLIGRLLAEFGLLGRIKLVLITNGSLMHKAYVQEGLQRMQALGGEVWFKLDRATREGMRLINNAELTPERAYANLQIAARLCPTWLQTCLFALDGEPPPQAEQAAYLDLLARARRDELPLQGVLLYGLARPSLQPEAPRLSRLPESWLANFAREIEQASALPVKVNP